MKQTENELKDQLKAKTKGLLDLEKKLKVKTLTTSKRADLLVRVEEFKNEIKELKKELKKITSRPEPACTQDDMVQKVIEEEIKLVSDSEFWLETFVDKHSARISDTGDISFDGKDISHVVFKSEFTAAYNKTIINYESIARQNKDFPAKIHKVPAGTMMAEVQKWYFHEMRKHRQRCLESIKYQPDVSDETLRQWLKLLTGNVKEYEVSIVKHWIQMVKRKLKGLDVDNHIFIIIFGSQGDGKTKAILKLIQVLKGLTLDYDLVQITDATLMGSLQDNAVVFFDEMGKANKADVNLLKRMITAREVSARPPYGAKVEKIKQNCSFIGATNTPTEDLIKDDEMRRFVEITSIKRTDDQYEQMDNIDALKIWQCVDEDANNKYFYENQKDVCRHQGTLSHKIPILLWAEERGLVSTATSGTKWCDIETLYQDYTRWMTINHYEWTGGSLQDFGKKLTRTVKIKDSRRQDLQGRKCTVYKIAKTSTIIMDSLIEKSLNDGLF